MKHTEQGWSLERFGVLLQTGWSERLPQWTEGGNQVRIWGTAKETGAGAGGAGSQWLE